MAKLTGNWYTDPMGEFYSWQDYEQLYREQEQSNINNNQTQQITEKDCKKCPNLEILDVDDEYIYRCSSRKEYRTSDIKFIVEYINNNNIKCRGIK